jgi:hypothetical protein
MNPNLLKLVIGSVGPATNWVDVADTAISMDEVLGAGPLLAHSLIYSDVQFTVEVPSNTTANPTPMEIDAFQPKQRFNGSPNRSSSNQNSGTKNQFSRWRYPGVLICGYCEKDGHLSKHCRLNPRNRNRIDAIHEVATSGESISAFSAAQAPLDTSGTLVGTPSTWSPYVNDLSATGVSYFTIPEAYDPLQQHTATQETLQSLRFIGQASPSRSPHLNNKYMTRAFSSL